MKYLIVNADDFGASHGINRGIMEAHRDGIVTSASLLVNSPWSKEAAALAMMVHHLSVGLHFDLGPTQNAMGEPADWPRPALEQQLARFEHLMGRRPTHLDSHHNVHRDPRLLPHFESVATEYGVPLRWRSSLAYCSSYYGQWNGESHLDHIRPLNLVRILKSEIGPGVTELSCHPGHVDADFATRYQPERLVELSTLCDHTVRRALEQCSIQLVNYHELNQLTERVAA